MDGGICRGASIGATLEVDRSGTIGRENLDRPAPLYSQVLNQGFLATVDAWIVALLAPLAVALLIGGVDDFLVDLAWAWMWLKNQLRPAASLFPPGARQLENAPRARIAIFVPLWQEHEVIAAMLEHNLAAIQYEDYHFFAGCYPNDRRTQEEVRGVAARFQQVHLALVPHDGPTSKADCLNAIFAELRNYEQRSGQRFDVIAMHDAEDMIHPEELRWINYYAARYDFVQTPVLPLPTPLHEFTHGVYCDEFAEYHSRDMNVRAAWGGFVPGSGVGTGFRRDALERLAEAADGEIFSPAALTEDYENGLHLFRLGCRQAFVPIAPHGGSDFVATREYFPRHFRAALRQRTRWVMGIVLQGWEHFGWRGSIGELYWLWRDRKGLVASPLSLLANVVFVYGLATGMWQRASPLALRLALATSAILLLRLVVRCGCVARIYGAGFAVAVPLRAVYGNVINTAATVQAVLRYARARRRGDRLSWLKTEHAYPGWSALQAHKRDLGDILVSTGKLTSETLATARATLPEGAGLGEHLVARGFLDQAQLLEALSFQQGLPVARVDPSSVARPLGWALPEHVVRRWRVIPFGVAEGGLLLACPVAPGRELLEDLRRHTRLEARLHLVTLDDFERLAGALMP